MNCHSNRSSKLARHGRATVLGLAVGMPVGLATLLAASQIVFGALPPVPQPPENPITEPKRVLGKILFWDEQLSSQNVVSCGTCHIPGRAGTDPRRARNPGLDHLNNTPDDIIASPGVVRSDADNDFEPDAVFNLQPQITARASVSMINAAYAPELFWDGRARGQFVDPQTGAVAIVNGGALESQAVNPVVNTVEMAHSGVDWDTVSSKLEHAVPLTLAINHPADVAAALVGHPDYPELFRRAFGDTTITAKRIAFAIATYERTLISDQSPFDRFRAGQPNALTPQQQAGLNDFQNNNCAACHSLQGDLTTNFTFRNIGLRPVAEDVGRQAVTGNPADRGRFLVPSLRNAGLKNSFMHNGQFAQLNQVIDFYARVNGAPQQFPDNQDPLVPAINLNPTERANIDAFIRTGLTDARVQNQTFPFDKPTLFSERPADQNANLGGGVVGTPPPPPAPNVPPRIVVPDPALVGNRDFRVGLNGALGGTIARLGISFNPPVAGRITPDRFFDPMTTQGTAGAGGAGFATQHWPLFPSEVTAGQVLFVQWFISDPAAAGGQSLSQVARLTFFCGSGGCPQSCGPADFNGDGVTDFFDYDGFVGAFEIGHSSADFDGDGTIDFFDYDAFVKTFEIGC